MTRYLTAPAHIAACDLGPATVILNYSTGGVHTLIGPSARWWADLATTGDPSTTTGLNPDAAAQLCDRLRQVGALIATATPSPWAAPTTGQPWTLSFGTEEVQAGRTDLPQAQRGTLLLAALALVLTLVAQHCGRRRRRMARLLRLLNWATGRTAAPAGINDAAHVLGAVRRVALLVPSRVACLEESAAAVLALGLSGRQATWCHGVAGDPIRLHAWVALNGQPVAEPPSTLRYTPLRTIPKQD